MQALVEVSRALQACVGQQRLQRAASTMDSKAEGGSIDMDWVL